MAKSDISQDSDQLLDNNDTWSNAGDWEEDIESPVQCPFCTEIIEGAEECFKHTKNVHNFNFMAIKEELKLNFYEFIRMVNYVRKHGISVSEQLVKKFYAEWRNDDSLLKPLVEADPLLCAFDDCSDEYEVTNSMEGKMRELQEKYNDLKAQFDSYRAMVEKSIEIKKSPPSAAKSNMKYTDEGNYYFDSYSGNEIHESMLKDTVRTEGYRDFVYNNKSYFKDKIVLDIGCGSGILSMFAAKAGAKHVYAVDNSSVIEKAKLNAIENNLNTITFIRGKLEDIELPVEKVDIIISEWMGYFLLFEGMLDSVLVGRDKWLAADGIMAPSSTRIVMAAYGDAEWYNDHMNFWNDVYGFKMSSMKEQNLKDALVINTKGDEIISDSVVVIDINTATTTPENLNFTKDFELSITKAGKVYALNGWFDTYFEGEGIETVMFSTSPFTKCTHWMQTLFILAQPVPVVVGDKLYCTIKCNKSPKNLRQLLVTISYKLESWKHSKIQEYEVN